jgi:hypothetical protein
MLWLHPLVKLTFLIKWSVNKGNAGKFATIQFYGVLAGQFKFLPWFECDHWRKWYWENPLIKSRLSGSEPLAGVTNKVQLSRQRKSRFVLCRTAIKFLANVTTFAPGLNLKKAEKAPTVQMDLQWAMSFSANAKTKITLDTMPDSHLFQNITQSIYMPSKEMVSFFEGFIALTDKRELPFDGTYRDLALNLATPPLKVTPSLLKHQLSALSEIIGGVLRLDGGRFYVISNDGKKREASLLAEGIRKIATLYHLINNGSLEKGATLFWDEPDSNINPKLVKIVAEVLLNLVAAGIQVVIATHSLFLLREFEILSHDARFSKLSNQFFALSSSNSGVNVQQGDTVDDVDPLILLDESLMQSDRFMAVAS